MYPSQDNIAPDLKHLEYWLGFYGLSIRHEQNRNQTKINQLYQNWSFQNIAASFEEIEYFHLHFYEPSFS